MIVQRKLISEISLTGISPKTKKQFIKECFDLGYEANYCGKEKKFFVYNIIYKLK
jgi:hypothetical protein